MTRLIERLLAWLVELLQPSTAGDNAGARDDDVLDAWLDEDEIDASGL